jgi:TolA-binding protein
VEELGAHEILLSQEESPLAFAFDEPAPPARPTQASSTSGNGALQQQVRQLEQQISQLRAQHRASLEEILKALGDLTTRVRNQLSQ